MRSSITPRARPTRAAALAALAALALLTLAAAHDSAAKESGGFIVRLGRDTVAAESFVIADTVQTGMSLIRTGRGMLTRYYTLTLNAKGNLARYEMGAYPPGVEPPGGRPFVHTIWTWKGDSIQELVHGDSTSTFLLASPASTLPFMDMGFGMWQVLTRRLAASGKDSLVVPMFFVRDTTHYQTIVKKKGADSVIITSVFGTGRAKIDARGMLVGYAAPGSTEQVTVTAQPNVDVKSLVAMFAKRPPIGPYSPSDTVRATVGGAHVWIAYSRPSARGRVIFGDVVPWNVWWRTGANAATTFVTDKDLVIAGANVPAGEYTLFTLPNPGDWKLIISRKTGEWGTDYDPAMDLARVPMGVTTLSTPMELMTIAITPMGSGAQLTVSWERTQASAMIMAK